MARAFRERLTRRRHAPHPWVSQPRPTMRPDRCVYCGVWPPTVLCGQEHTAYAGAWLCPCCYWRLFEGPILFPQAEQARPEERGVF